MTITAGTVAALSGTTGTSLSVALASTNVGDLNIITASVNSTGTGIQPVIAAPSGWTQIGDSWKTGTPAHELASFYRFYQAGDPTSVTVSWTATGNAAIAPLSFSAGMIDTTTPIVGTEKSFTQAAGATTDVTGAITLAAARYVVSVFGNRSGATWTDATDGNIHDAIRIQGLSSSAASVAVCCSGTTTSNGAARSLTSSASTSVNNVGIFALNPAAGPPPPSSGFYVWNGTAWKQGVMYVWNGSAWKPAPAAS